MSAREVLEDAAYATVLVAVLLLLARWVAAV
jgi:hypothetical protein